jgi:hypothetical protein
VLLFANADTNNRRVTVNRNVKKICVTKSARRKDDRAIEVLDELPRVTPIHL